MCPYDPPFNSRWNRELCPPIFFENRGRIKNEGHAGGVEHAGGGVNLFVEVLGFDEGVLTTPAGDDGVDMGAVIGKDAADMIGIDHKDTLAVVELFGILGMANFLREQGGTGPDGARQQAGGIGGSSHGQEFALVEGGEDVLGFVDDEKQRGSGTDDVGFGITGEEGNTGLVEQAHEITAFAPGFGGEGIAGEDLIEAQDGIGGLRLVGGVDGNDAEGEIGIGIETVCHELNEEFVLAGLAGKDDDKGVAMVVEDGIEEAVDGGDLVGTQGEIGGVPDKSGQTGEEGGEMLGGVG